ATRALVEDGKGFPVQPLGRAVPRQQFAVAPDGAVVVAADALAHLPPGVDVLAGGDRLPALGYQLREDRRRSVVAVLADPQHDAEPDDPEGGTSYPLSLRRIHGRLNPEGCGQSGRAPAGPS